jgi:hypothetical protein
MVGKCVMQDKLDYLDYFVSTGRQTDLTDIFAKLDDYFAKLKEVVQLQPERK